MYGLGHNTTRSKGASSELHLMVVMHDHTSVTVPSLVSPEMLPNPNNAGLSQLCSVPRKALFLMDSQAF
jgi:hypothetical protein